MRQLIGIVLLTLVLAGCHEKLDPVPSAGNIGDDSDGGDASPDGPVTYTGHIKPILDRSCAGCHSSGLGGRDRNGAPIGVNYDTYREAKKSATDADMRIQAGVMPPGGPLPAIERGLFEDWIDDGLLE